MPRHEPEHNPTTPHRLGSVFTLGRALQAARCGEDCPRSEMLVLEEEQGSPTPGAIERTLLDHA
jgi:hypothetical protein